MKYMALFRAFDHKLCGEWHSGNCTYNHAKTGLNNEAECEEWLLNMQYEYYKNNTDRYRFTTCMLTYDEKNSQNVEQFFKYM